MTPNVFGAELSQAMIGIQMAFAYIGFMLMPPLFGALSDLVSMAVLPLFLIVLFVGMIVTHEMVVRKDRKN